MSHVRQQQRVLHQFWLLIGPVGVAAVIGAVAIAQLDAGLQLQLALILGFLPL
ncbi:hypothetical protein [Bradyrhizobium sp.]|uniref:hypothetical protein n=1 Tax=Bradyrhizobium sp. TaxID=376 RepID=UPI0039E3EBFA